METESHLLFHCPFAVQVWNLAPFEHHPCTLHLSFGDLWKQHKTLRCLPPSGIGTTILAPWIVWNIWKARNLLIFKGTSAIASDTVSKAIAEALEWQGNHLCKPIVNGVKSFSLAAADPRCYTIQTDAAWNERLKTAGLGWTVQHSGHHVISSSMVTTHVCSPLVAEGLAIKEALKQALEDNTRICSVESDSFQLIKSIIDGSHVSKLHGILHDISSLSKRFESISFHFIPRTANVVADNLAKLALSKFVM